MFIVQQILIHTFEFTGAARGFMIMSCAARGVKKVGQHWSSLCSSAARLLKSFLFPGPITLAHWGAYDQVLSF